MAISGMGHGQSLNLVVEKNGKYEFTCGTVAYNEEELFHCNRLRKLEANEKIRIYVGSGTIDFVYFYGEYVRPF